MEKHQAKGQGPRDVTADKFILSYRTKVSMQAKVQGNSFPLKNRKENEQTFPLMVM